MNTNKGMDPMLCSFTAFTGDSIWNTKIIADIDAPTGQLLPLTSGDPVSPAPDSLLSTPEIEQSSFTDLASLWSSERKRVTSVKIEEDEGFSDVDSSEMDLEDEEIMKENISTVSDDLSALDSCDDESVYENDCTNFILPTLEEARRYVDEKFSHIAFAPNSRSCHKDKIQYILSLSDCSDYTVEQVLCLDKKSAESARVCAKIVQNIPQRHRWECVKPEQIPCCYTIVADCKKVSSRDKPPRPMNAFMIWAQGARRLINELCPKMQNAAISEALGFYWRQKTDGFKKKFELEKVKLRRFHDVEFPEYKYKPKTKVQKAKEKEILSLSRAKLSKTATKRKKPCDTNSTVPPKAPSGRKGRCGRPKKIKLSPEHDHPKTNTLSDQSQLIHAEEAAKMSPTKPAIKDMLTLKILNDRRTKEMAMVRSPPGDNNVQHFLGQLSPTDVQSPHTSDIFEELQDLDSRNTLRNQDGLHHRLPSSSVFDTPANTPPVDIMEDDTLRLSPVHLHKTQQASGDRTKFSTCVSSSSSFSSTHQNQDLSLPSKTNNSKCQLSPQASMPSLTAILSSGPNIPVRGCPTSVPGLTSRQTPHVLQSNRPLAPVQHGSRTAKSRLSSTDVILSCVSELLDYPDPKKDLKPSVFNTNRDMNNNSYFDFNNNNNNNSNNTRPYEMFSLDSSVNSLAGLLNPKSSMSMCGPSKLFDFNDLDMLCPDLNVPLLSDDVMSSLMNTL